MHLSVHLAYHKYHNVEGSLRVFEKNKHYHQSVWEYFINCGMDENYYDFATGYFNQISNKLFNLLTSQLNGEYYKRSQGRCVLID